MAGNQRAAVAAAVCVSAGEAGRVGECEVGKGGEGDGRVWIALRQEMIGGNDVEKAEKMWRDIGMGEESAGEE